MKIKAKPGYNVLIKDMGISLRATSSDWVDVDENIFNNSIDAQRVKNLLIIDGITKESKKEEVKEETFVHPGNFPKNPSDVFIKVPEEPVKTEEVKQEIKEEIKVEEIKEEVIAEEAKIEVTTIEEPKVEEPKVEEPKVEDAKVEEVIEPKEIKAPKGKKNKSVSENA